VHKSNRTRGWISVMLLLHLVAILLPARAVTAQAQTSTCGGESLQAVYGASNVAIAADQEVEIPKRLLDESIFLANFHASLDKATRAKRLVQYEFIRRLTGQMSDAEFDRVMEEFETKVEVALDGVQLDKAGNLVAYDEIVRTSLDVALGIEQMKYHVPAVWNMIMQPLDIEAGAVPDPEVQKIIDAAVRYPMGTRIDRLLPATLRKMHACAQSNPAAAKVFDKHNSKDLGVNIKDSATEVMRKKPKLAVPPKIKEKIQPDGKLLVSLNELKELNKTEFGKINASIDGRQETLNAIDSKQDDLLPYMSNQEARAVARAIAAANAAAYKETLDAIQSSISIIGTLTEFIAPEHAKQVSTILTSALTVADSMKSWLNAVAGLNGYPAISNKRLASPRDWLFATRAYAQLGRDWPAHMRRIDPQRQAQLNAISVDLEAAMRNISALHTLTNTQGNTLLFSNVITHYQGKLDQVDIWIQALEDAYLAEIRASLQQTQTFDLYAGIDQALTYQAPGLDKMSYGPEQTLPAPRNLVANIANFNRYNLAEYLAISNTAQIKVSFTGILANARQVPGCRPDPDVCAMMGDLSVFVGASYGKVSFVWMELKAGRVILPVIDSNVEEAIDYVARNWNDLKPRFEAESAVVAPSSAESKQRADLLSEITRKLEEWLAVYQHGLYGRVLNELNNGNLRASATEVAGGKALLESFVTLGLPRALDNDDFLRAMLFGNQRLVDNNQIMHSYAVSATQPITGANLLVNPRLAIGEVADRRTVAFSGLINRVYTDLFCTPVTG